MKIRTIELLTDLERELWQSTQVTGNATVPTRFNGVIASLTTHKSTIGSGVTVSLDETLFNDLFQWIWGNVAVIPTEVFVGAVLKRRVSGFTTGVTRNEDATTGMIKKTVDVYYSEFGRLQIHLSRDIPTGGGAANVGNGLYAIHPDFFKKAWLRTLRSEDLPKNADSYDGRCVCEVTLQTGHPAAGLGYQGLI
jgi:hypothetical protein